MLIHEEPVGNSYSRVPASVHGETADSGRKRARAETVDRFAGVTDPAGHNHTLSSVHLLEAVRMSARFNDLLPRGEPRRAGRQESDGSALTWIRAGFACIHRITDRATRPEAQAPEALAGVRPDRVAVVTRRHRRVTTQIRRLAWVFAIAFARNHITGRSGLLLESLSILRLARGNSDARSP